MYTDPMTDDPIEVTPLVAARTRVTAEDLETGDTETTEITDDYVVICDGSCYIAHVQAYPAKGTHVLTIKGRRPV